MPNPTLIAATQNNATIGAGATSATVTSTGNVTAGNLLIVTIEVAGATAPTGITPPAGWTTTLATTVTAAGGLVSAAIFTRAAASTAAFSGAFTWTTTSTVGGEWSFSEWSGAGALLIDGAATTSLNATSTTPPSPTITPGAGNVNDTLICILFDGVIGSTTITIPAGMSSVLTVAGGASQLAFGMASLALASASATGSKSWTLGTTETTLGVSLLIQQGPIWGWNDGGDADTATKILKRPKPTYAALKGRSEFAIFATLPNMDQSAQAVQPPYFPTTRQKFAAIAPRDDGNEFPLIRWQNTGWEIQPVQPPHFKPEQRFAAIAPKDDGVEALFINWKNTGWEIPSPQPPHPRFERSGAIASKDDGIQNSFVAWYNLSWIIQTVQPPHPRPERSGSIMIGDAGIESPFVPPPSTTPAGWEIQPIQPPHPRRERFGAIEPKDDGTQFPLINWFNTGWEIQPVQPPHFRPEQRFAAIAPRDDGNEFPLIRWQNAGWEIQPIQPRAFRASTGGIMPKDDGIQFTLVRWFNAGWEIQPVQPPHPRPEKSGAISPKDDGIENSFVTPPATPSWGLDTFVLFPHRPLRHLGKTWIDEPLAPNVNWFNIGWEIQPVQLPYRAPNLKTAAIARDDDGNEFPFTNWFNAGWEIVPPQPPHPRRERSGAIVSKDDGIESPFVFTPLIVTWMPDFDAFTPARPRQNRSGAISVIFDIFPVFPPGPIPPIPPGAGAAKVLGLDAAYGNADVTRFLQSRVPSNVNVGDSVAVLIGVGADLNLADSYNMVFTKPDGSVFMASTPQVYVGLVDVEVRPGIFEAQTYTLTTLPASFVDQHGFWSCYLQSSRFASISVSFYIGPPIMLN